VILNNLAFYFVVVVSEAGAGLDLKIFPTKVPTSCSSYVVFADFKSIAIFKCTFAVSATSCRSCFYQKSSKTHCFGASL